MAHILVSRCQRPSLTHVLKPLRSSGQLDVCSALMSLIDHESLAAVKTPVTWTRRCRRNLLQHGSQRGLLTFSSTLIKSQCGR